MKFRAVFVSAIIALALSAGADAWAETFYGAHVRALNPAGATLFARAQESSATVRQLVKELDSSDLIVYVRVLPAQADGPEATISYMSTTKMARLVSIVVSAGTPADRQIELLAHELVHAGEIADHAAVASDAQFQAMLSTLGYRDASRARGYETAAAAGAEKKVRREVRGIGLP